MKIVIYRDSRGPGYGGAENTIAVLAEALAKNHRVEFRNHRPDLTREALAAYAHTDLDQVAFQNLSFDEPKSPGWNPLANFAQAKAWNAHVAEDCDLFINVVNGPMVFNPAPHGILRVLFPFYGSHTGSRHPRNWYRRFEWAKRLGSYQFACANSKFTARWTKKLWNLDCEVIYSPVDTNFQVAEKTNSIVSLGRFTTEGIKKKQLEMVTAFREMEQAHPSGWEYYTLGGLTDNPKDQAYFQSVCQAGEGVAAHILPNARRGDLKSICERAKIFWHAAGYGEDEEKNPGTAEHFGQVTVEAMAAGCVPVVINKGGPPEVVDHGVDGFIWNTLDELQDYTRKLMLDDALRRRMSDAAREKSRKFNRQAFTTRFLEVIERLTA